MVASNMEHDDVDELEQYKNEADSAQFILQLNQQVF